MREIIEPSSSLQKKIKEKYLQFRVREDGICYCMSCFAGWLLDNGTDILTLTSSLYLGEHFTEKELVGED